MAGLYWTDKLGLILHQCCSALINPFQFSQGQVNAEFGPLVSISSQDARRFFLGTVHCKNIFKGDILLLMKELKLCVIKSGLIPAIGDCLPFQFAHST